MSSYATSTTTNQDMRNFAEGGSAIAGQGSAIAYPTSVSVYGSPESQVGDITFVTHAPAPADAGISDQLASILATMAVPAAPIILQPTAAPAATAAPVIVGTGQVPAKKPNYLLWAGLAAAAFFIWRM
jgi:hypothetical protein